MKISKNLKKYKLFIISEIIILLFFLFFKHYLLFYAGSFVFLWPLLLTKWSNFALFILSIGFLLDHFLSIIPYGFVGLFGQKTLMINKKFYGVPVIILMIVNIYKKHFANRRKNNVFDVLDTPRSQFNNQNQTTLVEKLLNRVIDKYKISEIKYGKFSSSYKIDIEDKIKIFRFTSLSIDFCDLTKMKVRCVANIEGTFIEIENKNKNRLFFKEFFDYKDNSLFAMEFGKKKYISLYSNIIYYGCHIIQSVIISVLISKTEDLDVILIQEDDFSFLPFNAVILNSPDTKLEDIAIEMERRYKLIRMFDNVDDYNDENPEKINRLLVILKLKVEDEKKEILPYILQNCNKVGIYIFCYCSFPELVENISKYFISKIISVTSTKKESMMVLGFEGPEFLTGYFDCLFFDKGNISRIEIPETNSEEINRLVNNIKI